jgi:multidrug resistance efflux pump
VNYCSKWSPRNSTTIYRKKKLRERQAAAEIIQAQRAFTAAQAKTAEAKAGIARAEALAQRWKSENDRVASLVGRGVIDEQTRDETINQYRSAQASLGVRAQGKIR